MPDAGTGGRYSRLFRQSTTPNLLILSYTNKKYEEEVKTKKVYISMTEINLMLWEKQYSKITLLDNGS